jgi:mono/diheme cytochrome c family protein
MLMSFFLASCYYDNEQLLYGGGGTCDTLVNVSYTQHVVPLFQQKCYGCHTGSFPSGNVLMGNYTADKAIAQKGTLYGSINHSAGYSAMPKGTPKMTICQISTVKKWIDAGLLNN